MNINGNMNTRDYKFTKIGNQKYTTKYKDVKITVEKHGKDWMAHCGEVQRIERYKNIAVDSVVLVVLNE